MATATTLEEAAGQAFDNLLAKWVAGTLKTNISAYCTTLLPSFLEQQKEARPISNWLTLIAAAGAEMTSGNSFLVVPYTDMVDAAGYVYRQCWMASQLVSQNWISGAQGAAILAAYNANF